MSLERVYLKTGTFVSFFTNIFKYSVNNKIVDDFWNKIESAKWLNRMMSREFNEAFKEYYKYHGHINELNRFNFSFFLEYSYMHTHTPPNARNRMHLRVAVY